MQNRQFKYTIYGLVKEGLLERTGEGRNAEYYLGRKMEEGQKVFTRAIQLGLEEMKSRGELPTD